MSDVSFSLKGFVSYGTLANNNRFETAPLGELSARAITFAKDRELLSTTTGGTPDTSVDVTVFSAIDATATQVKTPKQLETFLLGFAAWAYRQAALGSFTADSETFRQAALSEFDGRITDLTVAAMLTNGELFLPGSVSFSLVVENIAGDWTAIADLMESPRIKLWFSDDRFQREYDEFTYEFISPLQPLDLYFQQSAQVTEALGAVTFSDLITRANTAAGPYPYTIFRPERFNYQDPLDPTYKVPTDWGVLVWGAAGDNIDAIKERLIQWILANSTHTREEWAKIFPDIFTATEFIVSPFYSRIAVENMTIQAGVYSPVVGLGYAMDVTKTMACGTGYTDEHVIDNLQLAPIPYKSLAVSFTGGPENRNSKDRITDYYPDLMNVATGHPDFGRMSASTQGLVLMLEDMLKAAEEATEFSDIPPGMTRLERLNRQGESILYLVKSYEGVQYLVVTAGTMHRLFPPATYRPLVLTNEGADGLTSMPTGQVDVPYSTTFVAKGGTGVYTYDLPEAPYGVIQTQSIDPVTGEYTATFNAPGGDAGVRVRVRDSSNDTTVMDFRVHVMVAEPVTQTEGDD